MGAARPVGAGSPARTLRFSGALAAGYPCYMCPEIIDAHLVGVRADQYKIFNYADPIV